MECKVDFVHWIDGIVLVEDVDGLIHQCTWEQFEYARPDNPLYMGVVIGEV